MFLLSRFHFSDHSLVSRLLEKGSHLHLICLYPLQFHSLNGSHAFLHHLLYFHIFFRCCSFSQCSLIFELQACTFSLQCCKVVYVITLLKEGLRSKAPGDFSRMMRRVSVHFWFYWDKEAKRAITDLKRRFLSAPILTIPIRPVNSGKKETATRLVFYTLFKCDM